ncbi:basic salivary proline-rich protein 2-like [Varanus komodoensis]|uniref:basic salivary proline-rich protein 2-like n=1 Tax=Varanus komodoensis TaxID=61221 RepID=UPI001CF77747|nr:basic salivary proline-rich protein 2-like [Varanus komodoensis]
MAEQLHWAGGGAVQASPLPACLTAAVPEGPGEPPALPEAPPLRGGLCVEKPGSHPAPACARKATEPGAEPTAGSRCPQHCRDTGRRGAGRLTSSRLPRCSRASRSDSGGQEAAQEQLRGKARQTQENGQLCFCCHKSHKTFATNPAGGQLHRPDQKQEGKGWQTAGSVHSAPLLSREPGRLPPGPAPASPGRRSPGTVSFPLHESRPTPGKGAVREPSEASQQSPGRRHPAEGPAGPQSSSPDGERGRPGEERAPPGWPPLLNATLGRPSGHRLSRPPRTCGSPSRPRGAAAGARAASVASFGETHGKPGAAPARLGVHPTALGCSTAPLIPGQGWEGSSIAPDAGRNGAH